MEGALLGTAVGDALGLPAEGLSRKRIGHLWNGDWKMRLFGGRGMVSDDTEHSFMVAQSLLASPLDVAGFQHRLAWKLRWWFIGLPAGVGMATARACIKLWVGFPPGKSGVWSAGNGPAMRSAVIGAFFAEDAGSRQAFVVASSRMTHTDPRAEIAAMAVAETAALLTLDRSGEILPMLPEIGDNDEWRGICRKLADARAAGLSVGEFADSMGLGRGVTGYAFHTVPVAIYSVLRHPDSFEAALVAALDCGGDTDTVGAIVGALMGASVGSDGIPDDWRNNVAEWPRSMAVLTRLARELSAPLGAGKPVRYFWPGIVPRNLAFLAIIITHGFRRLLPPY
jgi:ADP-ribosylglycohydrolase